MINGIKKASGFCVRKLSFLQTVLCYLRSKQSLTAKSPWQALACSTGAWGGDYADTKRNGFRPKAGWKRSSSTCWGRPEARDGTRFLAWRNKPFLSRKFWIFFRAVITAVQQMCIRWPPPQNQPLKAGWQKKRCTSRYAIIILNRLLLNSADLEHCWY